MAQNQFLQSPFDALAPQTDTSIYTLPSLPGSEPVKPQEVPDVTRAVPAQAVQPAAEQEPVKAPPRRQSSTSNLLPPAQYAPIFEAAAREFDVPINVLMALGHQESRYNPAAIGQTTQWGRAKGMMQYLDSTASGLGINPFAAEESIPAAARQIRERLDKGYSMEDAVKEHFAGPNRKLWGAKTAAYGREVMEKVGRIGELLGTGAAPAAAADPLADLNKNEPGRYRVATPEEVAAFEKRQSAGLTVTPTNNAEQQKSADERGFFDRAGDAASSGYDNMVQSLNTAKFVIGGGDSLELARALSDKFAEQQKTPRTTGQKEMDAAFKEVSDAEGVVDTTVKGAKAIYTAITNPKDLAIDAIEQLPNMLPTMGAGAAGAGGGALAGAGAGALAAGVGAAPGAIAGAIWGGRAGMLAGTAATELGAEVEYMIGQQLAESRRAPTPENIKSILDSPGFIAAARDQGLKKGLTVAVIDQLFLGLGGKVAGKAGKAATVGGKAAYGAGAVALDATGEVVGESASQKVARGEVDAGDALKEGVLGLGQSVVEPVVGAGMQAAKKAGQAMRPTAPAPRVEPTVPPIASAPVAPGSQAPSEPVATAAPSPSGPLTGAVEKAAGATEQPPRVSVVAPEGEVTGFMQSMREDGQGGFTARVLGDDGQVYTFTSADGVTITPLAPEPAGPLTAAVEKVAEQAPSTPAQAPSVSVAAPNIPSEGVALEPVEAAAPVAGEFADLFDEQGRPKFSNAQSVKNFKKRTGLGQDGVRAIQVAINEGRQITLEEAMQADKDTQAKRAAALEQSKKDSEAEAEQAKANAATPAEKREFVGEFEIPGLEGATNRVRVFRQGGKVEAVGLDEGTENSDLTAMVASGMTVEEALAQLYGDHAQGATPDASKVKRADGQPRAAQKPLADMTEPELRERLKYIASQGKANGWNKMLTNARREVEREINRRAEGATTDARPDAVAAGVRDEAAGGVQADAPAGMDQPAGRDGAAQLRDDGPADTGAPVPQDGAAVSASGDAADRQPALTPKQSAALDRIAKGTAYFGSQEKAEAFIAKNGIGDTHEVVQTGKVRFEVKAKAPATAEESSTVQADSAPAIIPAGGTTTADEREPERRKKQSKVVPREMDEDGRAKDGKPINPGDVFKTLSGRETSPYPRQKSERYASEWLIENAASEAESRGDEFNSRTFRATKPNKSGGLTTADRESMLMYLFGYQPDVVPSILKPLVPSKPDTSLLPQSDSQAVRDFLDGKRPDAPTLEEVAAENKPAAEQAPAQAEPLLSAQGENKRPEASGTRVNGDAERAAADRLDQLYGEMSSITERNSREGNAKAAVRGAIEELRKPRTVVSVEAILEKASSDLNRKFGAFSTVIDEVLESISTEAQTAASATTAAQSAAPDAETKPQSPNVEFIKALAKAREELPEGFDIRAERDSISLMENGRYAVNGLSRNAAGAEEAVRLAKQRAGQKPEVPTVSENKVFTEDAAAKARALLRSKLGQLNTGIDPEVMQAGITLAGYHIEKGARTFAAYAKAMVEDLGDVVKPYLKSWYMGVKYDPRAAGFDGMSDAAEVEGADVDALLKSAPSARQASDQEFSADKVKRSGGFFMDLDYVAKSGDDAQSPWLLADGRIVGTGQDHISFADSYLPNGAVSYSEFMKETGAARASFFNDAVRGYVATIHVANGQKLTSEQIETLKAIESKRGEKITVLFGSADGMVNPEYKETTVSALGADQKPAAGGLSLFESMYEQIAAGNMPSDNNALRKMVSDFDGAPADNARLKIAQEALEAAIARRARDIVAEGGDVRQTYDKLVDLYQSQPNLNVRTSTSIENQAYSTPAPLAYVAAKLAGIGANTMVYEPTAGNGMLLITADPKKATANELEDTRFENLKAQGFDAIQGDALDVVSSGAVAAGSQDAVITNPPFGSVKDESGKATKVSVDGYKIGKIDHLIAAEALKAMRDGGKATLIIGADKAAGGVSTDDRIFFNWLYGNYNVTSHFEVDGKLYSRQGASWPVRVITVDGRRKSSNVSPRPGDVQRVATWEQVYEQYQQGLDAQIENDGSAAVGAGGAVQRDGADDAGTAPQSAGAEARRDGAAKPRARNGGAGNVAGERAGTVRDGNAGAAERVAGAAGAQRGDGAPAVSDRLGEGSAQNRPAGNEARADRPSRDAGADRVANEFQSAYVPRSSRKDEGVLIPVNMAQPTQDALNALEDEVGDIDEYAMRELGYPSKAALHDALMGLQVDSVASAIYQMGKGKGVIIADQTGIGKGRQAASIIRWAKRKGFVPVFVTVKPQLFTDMFNDLADIGTDDVAPLLLNADEWIANAAGEKLFTNKKSAHRKVIGDIAATGELPDGRNALFLTYSQINTENTQRAALSALAPRAVFILDESHNAGGQSQTGEYIRETLGNAAGVTYLSATYAKRPDNMPVYFKTDIGMAISDDGQLTGAMAAGGLPLQTVVSNNLVKAGQMFRRERSYDGVSISTIVATERRAEHEKLSDAVTEALRGIVDADRAFHNGFVEQMAQQLAAEGAALKDIAGNQASQSVNHTEFSSVVHNFVRQLLLGLKADAAADRAIEAIKAGEKPLIAVENTMGSFLAEYAAAGGIRPGQPLGNFDYRTVLSRALERSRVIVIKDPTGNDTKRRIELSELDPVTRDAYDRAQAVINGLDLDIPVSPIDWMRNRIEQAGYRVAEITGRNLTVDYSEGAPKLSQLSTDEQNDKVGTTRKFNDGRLDALILNVSGSTGISLHASEKFKDQRPRRMVVAQAAQDINIFMQMLGRIHRTGQVKLPSYEILSVDLPAEKRPTTILSNKMKSLNANTSSNTESATSIKSSDILNKYGDQVVGAYLADNMELSLALGITDPVDSEGRAADDLARKATGRLALMPVEVQKAFYAEVEEQYNNLIDYLNKTNQNELEPRTFDFDARETASQVIFEGENPSSPFGSDAIYHEYSIKAQGKPMTPDEIRAEIAESLGGKDAKQHAADIVAGLDAQFGAFTTRLTTDDQMAAANAARRRAGEFIRDHRIGSGWRVEINGDVYNAVVTNIRSTHKGAGNPFSMSKIQVTVALNGALRNVTVPATQFEGIEVAGLGAAPSINALFESAPKDERQTAKIITGNLLAAYGEISTKGTIINFTKADGSTEQGILLPKAFNPAVNTRGDYRIRTAADALKFLRESEDANIARFGISNREGTVRVVPDGSGVALVVPKSKAKGGKFFLNKKITDITGDFVSQGQTMRVTVPASKAADAVAVVMDMNALYALPSMAAEAKKIIGDGDTRYSLAYHGTPHRGIDKFNTDNIGTGEGAQAYGWGLYFASKREVAEYYRKNLSAKQSGTGWGGARIVESLVRKHMTPEVRGNDPFVEGLLYGAIQKGATADEVRAGLVADMKGTRGRNREFFQNRINSIDAWPAERKKAFDEAVNEGGARGQLYEVEIPEDDVMLLWDKPLSEQPEKVREALAAFDLEPGGARVRAQGVTYDPDVVVGEGIYGYISKREGGDKAASEALAAAGIKGIKYLDGTSRGAGDGSYNYVIFSGDDVAIQNTFYSMGRGGSLTEPALRERLTTGVIGPVVSRLIDAGAVVLHKDVSTLPAGVKKMRGIQAATTPDGKIHIVAEGVTAENARGVLLHEALHEGGEKLIGAQQWNTLMKRLDALRRQSEQSTGRAREFFDKARARVESAERRGAVSPAFAAEEFGAYAIEEYENAPGAVRKWVDDFIGAVKAWLLKRFGKQLGQVTPAQLSAIAKMALIDAAAARVEQAGALRFSAAPATGTPAFRAWFGDSAIKNADGSPKVMYHGTGADLTRFTPNKLGLIFVTPDTAFADVFAVRRPGDPGNANVLPVYVKAEKPFDASKPAHVKAVMQQIGDTRDATGDPITADRLAVAEWWALEDPAIVNAIKAAGFDGMYAMEAGIKNLAVFEPTQIKSAIGNNGDFDPTNPDIRYSVSPPVFDWSNPGGKGVGGHHFRDTKVGDTTISYGIGRDGTAEIISVRTPQTKRGNGSARRALEAFLGEADERGLAVKLQSSPLDKKTDGRRLFGFYKSLGFEPTGKKINAVGDPEMMRTARPPSSMVRYSVSPEDADRVLDVADKALDAAPDRLAKDDYIGRVVGDLSLGAKLIVHPRTVAAVHQEFTPVYLTAISQIETRDATIAELGAGATEYNRLDQAGKENVNKVLELGRLMSQTYKADELTAGVTNTGEKTVVSVGEDGKPRMTKVPVDALLSGAGEVIKLTPEEAKAYTDLRDMFDRALDKMRDQTLDELGFPELSGKKNAAAEIAKMAKEEQGEKADRLKNIAVFVAEIEQAKRAGYVPFARYGDYVVTVKEKVADLTYVEDDAQHLIVQDVPASFAGDMLDLGAEETPEGWRIKKSQKASVERLTEKTVYSTKVETRIRDFFDERKAGKVDDIQPVREAIEKARAEYVGDNPSRRVVAFKAREKTPDAPVRLSDVDALAEVAQIDNATWDAVRDKLADAIKAKGFRRHFFHSDNVPGYTGDFERAIADYVIGMSGYLARRAHMKRWENSVTAIKDKPKLFQYASKYRDYVNSPQEEFAMIRQIGFFSYIAGVLASAFANMTQVPMLTVPTLAQVAPLPAVMKEVTRAYKDAMKMLGRPGKVGLDMFDPDKAPADVRDALKEAWAEGAFVPLETYDLMMTARQRNTGARKGVKLFNDATRVVSIAFTFAERLNRLVTFIAAARLAAKPAVQANAKSRLKGDALARREVLANWNQKSFAEWVVDESQYRMGKANRPTAMRGVGAALMQFKGYMIQTFEAWYRMAKLHGKQGKFAMAASLVTLYAFAGLWGLPGADDLRKLIENIYKQITKKDLDLKTELRAWVAKVSGSNAMAQIVSKGASYPLGVDLTRVGMGSVVPDSPLSAAGIPFDMLIGRPSRAFEKASSGDAYSAAAEFTPNFMKHWIVAGGWAVDGVRDKYGSRILRPEDLSDADIGMKALGFQPSIVTDIRDYEYAQRRQETAVDGLKRRYTSQLAKALAALETEDDPAEYAKLEQKVDEVYAAIDEHNESAPDEQQIVIGKRALDNRIQREAEGIRSTWGKERKNARGAAEDLRSVFGLSEEDEE